MSELPNFTDAVKLERLDGNTFRAQLNAGFCIGLGKIPPPRPTYCKICFIANIRTAVPNGGYSASCALAAASEYLRERGQPDTLTVHFEFLNRLSAGPAIITVEELKTGKQLSTLQVILWQGKGMLDHAPWVTQGETKKGILAIATQANLTKLTGMSVPTGFDEIDPETRPAKPDLETLLKNKGDDVWKEALVPAAAQTTVRSSHNWHMFVPKKGSLSPGVLDMWMCYRNGEKVTQAAMPYVIDSFPYEMHMYLAAPAVQAMLMQPPPKKKRTKEQEAELKDVKSKQKQRAGVWLPTVVMNLENKALLPEGGARWLNMRVTSKKIDGGRFDIEVLVRDEDGDVVALSHHLAMVVSMERNMGKKTKESL